VINLDRAATIAKDFLDRTCGYNVYELQEISLKNDKWVVIYKPRYLSTGLHTVEVHKENGDILSFKRVP
jgi:hypothetical protein